MKPIRGKRKLRFRFSSAHLFFLAPAKLEHSAGPSAIVNSAVKENEERADRRIAVCRYTIMSAVISAFALTSDFMQKTKVTLNRHRHTQASFCEGDDTCTIVNSAIDLLQLQILSYLLPRWLKISRDVLLQQPLVLCRLSTFTRRPPNSNTARSTQPSAIVNGAVKENEESAKQKTAGLICVIMSTVISSFVIMLEFLQKNNTRARIDKIRYVKEMMSAQSLTVLSICWNYKFRHINFQGDLKLLFHMRLYVALPFINCWLTTFTWRPQNSKTVRGGHLTKRYR